MAIPPDADESAPLPPVVVVANRLPVTWSNGAWRGADGGLVPAVQGGLRGRGAAWVGAHDSRQGRPRLPAERIDLHGVVLDAETVSRYCEGFASRTLWPALHGFVVPIVFSPDWLTAYRRANHAFARAAARVCRFHERRGQTPIVWVHDYQLMLVPALLRRGRRPVGGPICFFLHTPFPPPGLFGAVPANVELLRGVLAADLVGLQTPADLENFTQACVALLGAHVEGDRVILDGGRTVALTARPASIDAIALADEISTPSVVAAVATLRRRLGGRRLVLGADRLDYTKGVPERLQAMAMLARRRGLEDAAIVQLAVPTRERIPEYRRLREQVAAQVAVLNRTWAERGTPLIEYRYERVERAELVAHYVVADAALVTPLRDGMNLVAKEYVVAQAATGGEGALILSRHAGAAHELTGALLCDPFDAADIAAALERGLAMPALERRRRACAMAAVVTRANALSWATALLRETATAHGQAAAMMATVRERPASRSA